MLFKTEMIGRVGKDATVSTVDGGSHVVNFSLCYSKKYRDGSGNPREIATWVECSYWKRPNESTEVAAFIRKGMPLMVEGQISADLFYGKKDEPQAVLKLRVEKIIFLPKAAE